MSADQPDRAGPVLFDIEEGEAPGVTPATAPPVPDTTPPRTTALQTAAELAARPPSRLARWFWTLLGIFIPFVLSIAAWNWITALLAANPILGWAATAITGALVAVLIAIAIRELAAFRRLTRLDRIHAEAEAALTTSDLGAARRVTDRLLGLYAGRRDISWGRDRLAERKAEVFDADGLFGLVENELLAPLDTRALREVEAAARQVATVTALVPLALADVVAALTANLRMIRRIAEIYGGRSGTLGSWRLTRSVIAHLVATGAVAVGDDLIGSVAGGGLLSKVSRRFGEGIVNGALTARVGVAAIEVCRPLPFRTQKRPSITALVKRALTGLFTDARQG